MEAYGISQAHTEPPAKYYSSVHVLNLILRQRFEMREEGHHLVPFFHYYPRKEARTVTTELR